MIMLLDNKTNSGRIMLGCGACKYGSRDPTWRDLTAMDYH